MIRRVKVPLVVGSGVAGLSTALGLHESIVVSAGALGSTWWAQGGIAAAVGGDDRPDLHARDTLAVSGGIAVRDAVELLTEGGPAAIDRLRELGARFDTGLGREAGHQRRRILHAEGDRTGLEVMRTLTEAVVEQPSIETLEGWRAIDLVRIGQRIAGLVVADPQGNREVIEAPAVILATGGIGRLYLRTTNPPGVTGDGLAMAARIGVRLADLEFVQFHPTALDCGLDPLPLLTEALRGEGALLVDGDGDRFMVAYHPDAELAPRDVVARAIFWQLDRGQGAFLDARAIEDFPSRFPTVFQLAQETDLDPRTDLLPVSPAAHYYMGGIDADRSGRTSLEGLWAVGEVASTGVHGANRLASNSLLEGLVFGARVANDVSAALESDQAGTSIKDVSVSDIPLAGGGIESVRAIMWERVGLVRTGPGLWEARNRLLERDEELRSNVAGRVAADVARLVVAAALRRSESRGGHYRADYPEADLFQANRNLVEPIPIDE
jgi:L-aspartate oxidase